MSDFSRFAMELEELAAQTKVPPQQILTVAAALEKREERVLESRRATADDRAKIDAYLGTLNGAVSDDLPISDILTGAQVAKKQGTSQYAVRAKQKMIAHYKPAA
jgi:hypothetical protein